MHPERASVPAVDPSRSTPEVAVAVPASSLPPLSSGTPEPTCTHCSRPEREHFGRGVWCTRDGWQDTDRNATQFRPAPSGATREPETCDFRLLAGSPSTGDWYECGNPMPCSEHPSGATRDEEEREPLSALGDGTPAEWERKAMVAGHAGKTLPAERAAPGTPEEDWLTTIPRDAQGFPRTQEEWDTLAAHAREQDAEVSRLRAELARVEDASFWLREERNVLRTAAESVLHDWGADARVGDSHALNALRDALAAATSSGAPTDA